ncbi:MAG: hypothetical protein ACJ76A_07325 [Actinomycetota bacterium]
MQLLRRPTPLSLEEVDAWRAWSVVERGGVFVLSSLTRAEVWEPGRPFVATCTRARHEVPGARCSCGVYAAADANELAGLGRIAGAAVGRVSLWGRLVEHSRGYRAAAAYPTRIRLVCVACLSEGRGEPAAVMDCEASGERTRLRPLCESHAVGSSLPSARPVEAALLASYQIDPLPDASVRQIRRTPAARRVGRMVTLAAAVVVVASVAAGAVAFAHARGSVVNAIAVLPPPGLVAPAGRPDGPIPRTGDGLRTVTHAKLSALSPFPTVHCGRMTPTNVVPTPSCADRASNVFVEDVGPAGAHRYGTCSRYTVAKTRRGDRILCWRALSTP